MSINCSSAPENTPLGEGRAWLDHWMAPQPPQDAGLAELTLKAALLLPLLQGTMTLLALRTCSADSFSRCQRRKQEPPGDNVL